MNTHENRNDPNFDGHTHGNFATTTRQPDLLDTLANAKRELWDEMKKDGTDCPCCGRFAKLYAYKLSKAQMSAFTWIMIQSKCGSNFVNVQDTAPKWLLRSNSHGKLVHWGLLEMGSNEDQSTASPGRWRPTRFGVRFFNGNTLLHDTALVFDNQCHGLVGEEKYYADVFDSFHYGELMKRAAEDVI